MMTMVDMNLNAGISKQINKTNLSKNYSTGKYTLITIHKH